jgi:phospholipid/cholesterol/gamma-HCH transport system permease protein
MFSGLYHFGRYILFLFRLFTLSEKSVVYYKEIMREVVSMGIGSLMIVFINSLFVGAVTTVQTAYQLVTDLVPRSTIGAIVSASALLELAPTITSLVLAGKIGSSIAGQIGTMRTSEQIDALDVMGINSASYLVLPKIMGAILSFPCLAIIAAFLMHIGGILAGDLTQVISSEEFIEGARDFYDPFNVTFMVIKSVTFGFLISSIAAYQGYYVSGGANEVGQASTQAVVMSCIMILFSDYVLAALLL